MVMQFRQHSEVEFASREVKLLQTNTRDLADGLWDWILMGCGSALLPILMMMLHTDEAAFNNARFKCAYRRRCHQSDKCLFCANNSQEPPATGKMFAHRVLGNLSKIGLRDLKHIEYIVLWIEFRRRK